MRNGKDHKLDGVINRVGEWFGYLFMICVAIIGVEVVARYIFNSPSIWVHETTVMLVAINFAVGGVIVLYEKAHINITALYDAVPQSAQRVFDFLISAVLLAYLSLLTYAAWVITAQAWRLGERSGTAWNPPLPIILKTALLVSAATMAVIALAQLIGSLRRLKG